VLITELPIARGSHRFPSELSSEVAASGCSVGGFTRGLRFLDLLAARLIDLGTLLTTF
jgi:hypothetical protein